MITEARPMPGKEWKECVFKNGSMSNEDYHKAPGVSSSALPTILFDSPAAYKYKDPLEQPTQAMEFGTASHAALLEPEMFDSDFYRIPHKDDEGVIATDKAVMAILKELGVPGYTTKKGMDLYKMLLDEKPDLKILKVEQDKTVKANEGKIAVDGDKFDKLHKMRKVMVNHPEFKNVFNTMFYETSIFCQVKVEGCDDWIDVKIRPDMVTQDYLVPDYKTTADATPRNFCRHAERLNYDMRMMFTCDVLSAIYGKQFTPSLMAQSTKSPYIPAHYVMDHPATQWFGRQNYTEALVIYAECLKSNKWPADYSRTQQFTPSRYVQALYEEFMQSEES